MPQFVICIFNWNSNFCIGYFRTRFGLLVLKLPNKRMRYISNSDIVNQVLRWNANTKEHCVYSPTCNLAFFHLLRELLDETTKSDLENTFDYDLQNLEALLKSVNEAEKKLAFKIVLHKNYLFQKETESSIMEKFNPEIELMNDQNPPETQKSIENWLKTYTNGIFPQLNMGPSINRATSYTVSWEKKFDQSKSTKGKFYSSTSVGTDIEMMNISGKFKYYENDESIKIVELPISKDGTYNENLSVLIYLPGDSNTEELTMLPDHMFQEIVEKMEDVDIEVSIPKCKIKTECNIKEVLKSYMEVSK